MLSKVLSGDSAQAPELLFELGPRLGKGQFGAVYRAVYRPTGATVAVKVMRAGWNAAAADVLYAGAGDRCV
jgi:hypothetical protein